MMDVKQICSDFAEHFSPQNYNYYGKYDNVPKEDDIRAFFKGRLLSESESDELKTKMVRGLVDLPTYSVGSDPFIKLYCAFRPEHPLWHENMDNGIQRFRFSSALFELKRRKKDGKFYWCEIVPTRIWERYSTVYELVLQCALPYLENHAREFYERVQLLDRVLEPLSDVERNALYSLLSTAGFSDGNPLHAGIYNFFTDDWRKAICEKYCKELKEDTQ